MNLHRLLPALVCLCATLAASAQTFTDNLAVKRSYLVYKLRALGPLAPSDWLAGGPLWVVNTTNTTPLTVPDYLFTGNYAYRGVVGSDYDYSYQGVTAYQLDIPSFSNPATHFSHFGLHEQSVQPYPTYNHFATDANAYNIAGLRYQALWINNAPSGGIYLNSWIIQPGESFWTSTLWYAGETFDLAQYLETPVFRVSDYWFGWWPNFPADPKVGTPQDTRRQSAGAFLVANLNVQTPPLIGWAEEGVYRPGFTLQPGYSSPRVNTFMQQYFGDAWKCDATTGIVPRTSTMNWNNVGRINTNSAVRTGVVNPYGYFTPNEFGKAILTTRTVEDGSYGELPIYTLAMFVDKNRDGTLDTNDVTTASNPHVFWVNNDYDRAVYSDGNLWDELDIAPSSAGMTDADFIKSKSRIPSLRDLEDFDRLHVRGLKELCRDLPATYAINFRWKTVFSGNPGIYVLKAMEADGGRLYLLTNSVASAQIAPSTFPPLSGEPGFSPLAVGAVEPGVSRLLHASGAPNTNDFFLYCGTSRGAGELAVTVSLGGQVVGEASVFLDLRDVKELYERWTVGEPPNWQGAEPATTSSLFGGGLPGGVNTTAFLSDTNQPYILYVHGWNMSPDEKDFFAETAFKRLYWQGYTNRFGAFRWPTAYDQGDALAATADITHFNRSEFYAWKSAEGLRSLLVSLNQRYPGKTYLLAHSMGNIVAGEALALNAQKYGGGQIVNTYVASQAAVSLHAYNGTNSNSAFKLTFNRPPMPGFIPGVNWFGTYIGDGLYDLDHMTLNLNYNWLATNKASCVRRVNFYNVNDFALAKDYWEFNQVFKPGLGYRYAALRADLASQMRWNGIPPPTIPVNLNVSSTARLGASPLIFRFTMSAFAYAQWNGYRGLDWEYNQNDMYEALAFCSESRVKALGATWDELAIQNQVSLWTIWPTDDEANDDNARFGRHKWHSAQFRSHNMKQNGYWRALLDNRGFVIWN